MLLADVEMGQLDRLFARAQSLRIEVPETDASVLLRGDDIGSLRRELFLLPERWPPCRCRGEALLRLFAGAELLTTIVLHREEHLTFDLLDQRFAATFGIERVLGFLCDRGVEQPLRDYQSLRRLVDAAPDEERANWILDAPAPLQLLLPALEDGSLGHDVAFARHRQAYAEPSDAAAALLAWLGWPHVSWLTRPRYEDEALAVLARFPIAVLIQAIEGAGDWGAELSGAARYFALIAPKQLGLVPEKQRARIRQHLARTNPASLPLFDSASRAE
jgi:hypothetical protein